MIYLEGRVHYPDMKWLYSNNPKFYTNEIRV
jgi:hypothetical protein